MKNKGENLFNPILGYWFLVLAFPPIILGVIHI